MKPVFVWILLTAGIAGVAQSDPLSDLVATERAFAAAARANGWRSAFGAYFAPDSIAFTPDPVPMLPRIRSQPNRPASEDELNWEPRVGDVAASGDLGWLSGPSTHIDHAGLGPEEHGNYFSIWKRQPSGAWRVYIDIGTKTSSVVPFADGFTAAALTDRYVSTNGTQRGAKPSLMAADAALNSNVARIGPALAYRAAGNSTTRLHRNGSGALPAVGAAAIGEWLLNHTPSVTMTSTEGEVSRAGDLGYVYGTYRLSAGGQVAGAYIRMWARRAAGGWILQVDAVVPTSP